MPEPCHGLAPRRFDLDGDDEETLDAVRRFAADAIVVLDPPSVPVETLSALGSLKGLTLGMLPAVPADADVWASAFDRVVCFDPALTGSPLGTQEVWRAVPPPVSDRLFAVRLDRSRRMPAAMSLGRSTAHREAMLTPSKHDHNLLQALHGVAGSELVELLAEYDVGVYVPPEPGGSFGHAAGVHLAAGQLLLSERLTPAHGLECGIDYVKIDSPESLAWTLHRLGRFPEMYEHQRVRGRMKAEHLRASRIFGRLLHDLRADVAAFGQPGSRRFSA